MTKKIHATVAQLGEIIKQDYLVTSNFIKVLESIGIAKKIGTAPQEPGKRGKPSSIYEIDAEIELSLLHTLNEKNEEIEVTLPEGVKVVEAEEIKTEEIPSEQPEIVEIIG